MTGRLVVNALALLACVGLSCAPRAPTLPHPQRAASCLHYSPVDGFASSELAALDESALVWRASGVCVQRGDGDVKVKRLATGRDAYAWHRTLVDGDAEHRPAVAFFDSKARTIYMIADRVDGHWREVWIHEIGHALGARHVPLLHACMFEAVTSLCALGGHVLLEDADAVLPQYRFQPRNASAYVYR